ncbi:hypothetical protein [Peribacillus frigoritolerans]|uniref:hypothetical protein n=1 Tax=Peribacillus frigoritolerans TaxID=450367 RepID=UPI003D2A6B27
MDTNRFNNFTEHKIHREAQRNLSSFTKYFNFLEEYGDRNKAINNIEDMNNQYTNLITNGTMSEKDWQHDHLTGLIEDATKYLRITKPSVEDIRNHYDAYENFNDTVTKFDKKGN